MEHEGSLEGSSRPSNNNHVLPFELLGEVFSYISDDPLDLRYAIFVCRSWHNAIVHCAKLWTNIIIKNPDSSQGDRLPHAVAFIRSCLSRSSGLPLHISTSGNHFSTPKRGPFSLCIRPLRGVSRARSHGRLCPK